MATEFPSTSNIDELFWRYSTELHQLDIDENTLKHVCKELSTFLSFKSICMILEQQNKINDKLEFVREYLGVSKLEKEEEYHNGIDININ